MTTTVEKSAVMRLAGWAWEEAPTPDARFGAAPGALESVSTRKISLMRFVLTLSSLIVILIYPPESERFLKLTHISLLIYTIYSAILFLGAARVVVANIAPNAQTWIDVGCYLVLIALSGGTVSIYYYYFFFSILVASFRGGFESGMKVTFVSALLFTVVGYAASTPQEFQLNRFLLRPVCLLVLGYMIAVWGGSEVTLKRKLALLKGISKLGNPRFGVDQTLGSLMESVRKFFGADTCLLVAQDREGAGYLLRRADGYRADRAMRPEKVIVEIGCQLVSALGEEAVGVTSDWWRGHGRSVIIGPGRSATAEEFRRTLPLDSLTTLLGEGSFISVPWRQTGGAPARLYLTTRVGKFDCGDLEFLLQVVEHAVPLIENIELLDRLASTAAEQERRRISRDLHDSTIQPYIGLKMGLESVCRKAPAESPLLGDLRELLTKTEIGLADLRLFVRGLKRDAGGREEPALAAAVRQYSDRFTRLSGVEVACDVEPGLDVADRLSAEAFQIVREGLSNVHRHTRARAASVRLSTRAGSLVVEVENEAAGEPWRGAPFTPRSISERSEALGGKALVDVGGGRTLVRAEIPL